jgi:hypothetical protein
LLSPKANTISSRAAVTEVVGAMGWNVGRS